MSFKQWYTGFAKGMKNFGEAISTLVNTLLLLFVYGIGVSLSSLLSTLAGKHKLKTKISRKRKTYWSHLDLKKKPIEEYYRQF